MRILPCSTLIDHLGYLRLVASTKPLINNQTLAKRHRMINDTRIKSSSGRLWGILQRREFHGGNEIIADSYAVVESLPPEIEKQYLRPLSKSHNPMHARIALILINDAKEQNAEVIAAGILSSQQNQTIQQLNIAPAIKELAILSHLSPPILLSMYPPTTPTLPQNSAVTSSLHSTQQIQHARLIRACLALDEGRHLHLLPKDLSPRATIAFLEMANHYLLLAQNTSPRIHTLLEALISKLRLTSENE